MNDDEFIVRNLIEAARLITDAQNKIFRIEGRERLEHKHAGAKTGFRFSTAMSIAEAALLLKEQVDELESDVMR